LTTSSAARRIEIPVRRKEYAWKPKTPGARLFPTSKFTKGKLNEARALCDKFVEKTREAAKVMSYGFTFDADHMHCREGYQDADGVLARLENVGELFKEALKIATSPG
jgi:hypothetical protein